MAELAKQCPRCGVVAAIGAAVCGGCGRIFRTRFTVDGEPVARPRRGGVTITVGTMGILGLALSLLAATNPDHGVVAAWMLERVAETQPLPASGAMLLGESVGAALAPGMVQRLFAREDWLVCSVFRPRYQGGPVLLGIGGRVLVLREAEGA